AGRIGHVADAPSTRRGVIVCPEDGDDARELGGGRGVDRQDACMGVRRSNEGGIGLAIEGEIVGEATAPGDKPQVLKAGPRPTDIWFVRCVFGHRASPGVIASDRIGWVELKRNPSAAFECGTPAMGSARLNPSKAAAA